MHEAVGFGWTYGAPRYNRRIDLSVECAWHDRPGCVAIVASGNSKGIARYGMHLTDFFDPRKIVVEPK
jgi:hypothetical protein